MAKTLESIVAITHKDPWQARVRFLQALTEWAWSAKGRRSTPIEEWPDSARLIWTMSAIHAEILSSGLLYLIDREPGDHVAEARSSARKIGAKQTVKYLDALAAIFPGKEVPRTVEERATALETVFPDDEDMLELDAAIRPIDAKYRELVLDEIPDRLREHVATNLATFEKEASLTTRPGRRNSPDDVILFDPKEKHPYARQLALLKRPEGKAQFDAQGAPNDIGDVIEVRAFRKYVYVQVTHRHFYDRVMGPVVRVLPGAHPKALTPKDVEGLVKKPELYFSLFNAPYTRQMLDFDPDLYEGSPALRDVGNFAVPPQARQFPTFMYAVGRTRDGRPVRNLWRGGELPDSQVVGILRDDSMNLPCLPLDISPDELVRNVREGWKPIDEHRSWDEA